MDGGALGILNRSAIQSAIARPYHGYHPRIHQKAAALVHAIVTNHGFVDGNKRTALYLVELLAVRSGYRLSVEDLVVADIVTAVARGELGYEELAAWFEPRLESSAQAGSHPETESTDNL
ncbi:MAG: type II toxin-antitoxin system death-on-curing family toxin [Gammaproteobacteria bacterium]|nr:type II toxin-antitoxin system death-on-curing family toxin [Gammaproteobacteria bacterium]